MLERAARRWRGWAMLRKMKEAGVLIGLGTDLVFDWFP